MLIYKDGLVADYREFFPNSSFPETGVSDEFLQTMGAYRVSVFLPHDRVTEKLVACDPYIDPTTNLAITVRVENKTAEELEQDKITAAAKSSAARAAAYRNESDPIFFKWQRGEATKEEWLNKIEEIKTRY